jgi:hypothetical protein
MVRCTETTALDFLGNEFGIGDEVVICEKNYRRFLLGTVVRMADQKAQIEFPSKHNKNVKDTLWVNHDFCVARNPRHYEG